MVYVLGIIIMLIVFSVIVFFHEMGHFLSAKIFGIKVDEFGMGLPPRLFKLYEDSGGTVYSVNMLPIGGFVSLKGEQFNEVNIYDEDSLVGASFYKQVIIILAGVFMNFFIAGVIFSTLFYIGTQPFGINTEFETTTKTKLVPGLKEAIKEKFVKVNGLALSPMYDSVAMKAGIKDKDVLIAINGKKIVEPEEMINAVKYKEPPIRFTILREGKKLNLKITPIDGKIGCYIGYNYMERNADFLIKYPLKEAIKEGFKETYNQSAMTLEILSTLVRKIAFPKTGWERGEALSVFGGPISLGSIFIDLASVKSNFTVYIAAAGLLSINLAVFNLLPIPALDGGRFFIMLINGVVVLIFGKKIIDERTETLIHVFGYIFLIAVSILIAFSDIMKLIHPN